MPSPFVLRDKIRSLLLGNAFLQKENTVDACQKTLDIHIVREHIISLLEETENTNAILTRDRKVEQNLLHDLEIFQTYDHAHMSTLSHAFKKGTRLSASSFYIETLLRHYAAGADQVYQRQRVLQTLFRKHNRIDIILERLATNEEALAWMIECKQHQTDKHSLHDIAFLQNHLLQWLNRNGTFLTAYNIYRIVISPLIGLIMPILYIIIPFVLLRYYFGVPLSFSDFVKMYTTMLFQTHASTPGWISEISRIQRYSLILSIVFYFQGVFNSVEIARLVYKASDIIHRRTRGVMSFLHDAEQLQSECKISPDDLRDCQFHWHVDHEEIKNVGTPLLPFTTSSRAFGFGDVLAMYHKMDVTRYVPLLRFTYMIDCLTAISKWCFASDDSPRCLVEFRSDYPGVDVKDVCHPCIEKSVTNDVSIDAQNNVIITGPNAGGKSTLVKSIMMAVYLAHVIGVAPCSRMRSSFFTYINTQISVPDVAGVSSLFEAEMRRAKYHLDKIDALEEERGEFAIVAMDEIFNSTNPIEGISAAYAVAHALGKNTKTVSLITTHYHYLCGLEKETGRPYRNFKMDVTQDASDGQVVAFHYKLTKGISRQFIALELLKRDHFDDKLVAHALQIKNGLLSKRKPN